MTHLPGGNNVGVRKGLGVRHVTRNMLGIKSSTY